MPTPPSPRAERADPTGAVTVTAVVVAHHGDRWLPGLRAALAGQTRPPDALVGADTSGSDTSGTGPAGGSVGTMRDWLGAGRLVELPARTGFGTAVARALELAPAADWVWVLHDDCAPAPGALEQLLAEVARDPRVAVAGPKVLGLGDRRLLLEVGVTIARGGRRDTGLERREHDQGQHDGTRPVLAVGTAGMLVRRDVWDALGGLDRRLPLLRDDVDLGWRANLAGHRVVVVPAAVVHHAEAGSHRRRPVHVAGGRLHRLDRQHALFVLLANLPLVRLPVALPWLTVATLLRALALLAGKRPAHAADESLALLAVVGRPDRLLRARWSRRRTRTQPARSALPLLAPRGAGVRHAMEGLSVFLGTREGMAGAGRHRAATSSAETGPTSDDAEDLPVAGGGVLRRTFVRPSVLLAVGLVVLGLLAARGLLGEGRLMGGALLPAPTSASGLWRTYTSAWHPVGLGSDTSAPPYLAVLAALAAVLFGSAERAVDLLLLGAVPLAGVTAYLALRRLVRSVPLRLWGAVTYALLPPLLGAVAAGRLGTVVLAVLLPMVVLTTVRGFGLDGRPASWRACWGAGLLVAAATAFVPLVWGLATVTVLLVAATSGHRRAGLGRAAVVALVPPLLLLPWLPALVAEPQALLLEAGLPGPHLAEADLDGLDLLLLHPGGPGLPPLALAAGLVLAALAGLLRPAGRRVVLLGWLVALGALAGALGLARTTVTATTLETPVPAWPGPLVLVAGAALVVAAVAGGAGARARVAGSSFGWRQPTALLVAVLAAVTPLLLAGWWVWTGAGDPVQRRDPVLLPAFVAAEGAQPDRPRTLVLRARADGALSYALLRSDGPRTGDAELTPPPDARLDAAVADLASGRGGDAAARLVPFGVRFVLLTRPVDRPLARAISAVPGVLQVSGQRGTVLWRVDYPTGRVRVLPPGAPVVEADGAAPPAKVLAAGQVESHARVGAGPAGRLLVLADARDGGWRATVDGTALASRRYDGWAQAFVLPAGGGRLDLSHDPGPRSLLLWVQLGLLVLVVVLALPQVRASLDDADGDSDVGADLPEPAAAGARAASGAPS
jgi:GT2 family glycosyltransferase